MRTAHLNSARRRLRREQLARRHGMRCTYCRRPFASLGESTLDHIAPLSLWRSWSVTSLMLACVDCNQAKADRFPLSLALVLLAWADPNQPVVRPACWPVLARLAADHHAAVTSVTARVTPDVTPDPTSARSTPCLRESTPRRGVQPPAGRPDCLRAPRPVRTCAGPTQEAVAV